MKRILVILSLLLTITACAGQTAEVDSTPLEVVAITNTAVEEEVAAPTALPVVVVEVEPTAAPPIEEPQPVGVAIEETEETVETIEIVETEEIEVTAEEIVVAANPAAEAQPISQTVEFTPCPICDFDYSSYTGPLTADEVNGLLLALNDEYHAWAVYGQVITDFGQIRPFTNIQRAEQNHINALVRLFNLYELPIPANPWIGAVPSFETVGAACQTGYEAEVINAELYAVLFASTERPDIEQVYSALQQASNEGHLPAFERCMNRNS
ncbi:MAG: hypothetical protein KDE51_01955 [Anaerolineales bacterium]|nr:hypothetical protein [Anaerolineales bacterium]